MVVTRSNPGCASRFGNESESLSQCIPGKCPGEPEDLGQAAPVVDVDVDGQSGVQSNVV